MPLDFMFFGTRSLTQCSFSFKLSTMIRQAKENLGKASVLSMALLIPPDPTADGGTTNDDRASWAEAALLVFAQRTGLAKEMVGDREDPFLIVSDLLADLAHWCDRHRVDLPSALAHAARHYLAETAGTGEQFK